MFAVAGLIAKGAIVSGPPPRTKAAWQLCIPLVAGAASQEFLPAISSSLVWQT
jgi:hypothetical protein